MKLLILILITLIPFTGKSQESDIELLERFISSLDHEKTELPIIVDKYLCEDVHISEGEVSFEEVFSLYREAFVSQGLMDVSFKKFSEQNKEKQMELVPEDLETKNLYTVIKGGKVITYVQVQEGRISGFTTMHKSNTAYFTGFCQK